MTKMDAFDGEAGINRHVKLIPNGDGTWSIAQAVAIDPGDINIGTVELKGGENSLLASIAQAQTAAGATTNVLRVQPVDATGAVIEGAGGAANESAPFNVNDIDDPYYGFTDELGSWLVKKVEATGVSYASMVNNISVTSYADAWTGRAALTYGRYDQAF